MGKTPKKPKGKLPSGSVRVQVYWYTDDSGKRHYKSFTAPTRKEALQEANSWKVLSKKERPQEQEEEKNITVKEAVERYIAIQKAVLSPSTIRGYEGMKKQYFSGTFGQKEIIELDRPCVQIWISDLSSRLSPKTVRNAYGLFSSSIDMFNPGLNIKATLPQKKKPNLYCPNDNDVKAILNHIKGTELEIAVLLAAFGPLRRGEICALTDDDVKGNIITVRNSMVKGSDGKWHIKQPKTEGSYREVVMPAFVIQRISGISGRLVSANPDRITHNFEKALKKANVPHFRFHDLRHYAASIMHAIGIPDQYIMERGGWSGDHVMKNVYRNVIDIERTKQNKKINQYFEELKIM